MQKLPFVSVIMPVYNAESFLKEAIESILHQSYKNFEFIIIDDHSTDSSWSIVQQYKKKDKRIKAFKNKQNLKIVKTRNKGFEKAKKSTDYYAIMDSDDISLPYRLQEQVAFLEKWQDVALVGAHNMIINEKGKRVGLRKYPTKWNDIKSSLVRVDQVSQPTAMIRAEVLRTDIGFYNERYTRCQDYDLWLRIGKKYKIANINKPLLKYRISTTQGKSTHLKTTIRFTLEIQRKWMWNKRYFSMYNTFYILAEHILLLLPKKTVLWLFKKVRYD